LEGIVAADLEQAMLYSPCVIHDFQCAPLALGDDAKTRAVIPGAKFG